MGSRLFIFLWFLTFWGQAADEISLYFKVQQLNRELSRRDMYIEDLRQRMTAARAVLDVANVPDQDKRAVDSLKWEAAYELFSAYSYMNVDSTMHYASVLDSLSVSPLLARRSQVCALRARSIVGDVNGLYDDIMAFDPLSVDDAFVNRSCDQLQRASSAFADDMPMAKYVMGRAMEYDGLRMDVRLRYQGLWARFDGDYVTAQEYFQQAYDVAQTVHLKALSAFNIASCYKYHGNSSRYCYWLAQSAIYDIQVPVREYLSVLELARELNQKGKYNLAVKYIRFVMQDAINGHWDQRVHVSAKEQLQIGEMFLRSERQRTLYLLLFISLLVLFAVYITVTMLRSHRHNRELMRLTSQMRQMNARLKDEGVIKEKYLFDYMEKMASGLGSLEDYKHELRRILKEEGEDALRSSLRSPSSRSSYREFYDDFDKTFLALYPDFALKVNFLMKEGCKFPETVPLCTDLRILATIRLGFKDSGQIARFLNVPATSVYTRRSAMRRNSTCGKDVFESEIRQII